MPFADGFRRGRGVTWVPHDQLHLSCNPLPYGQLLRLATWNVDCVRPGTGARSDRIRQALVPIDPDVWILTESHPDFSPGASYDLITHSAAAQDRERGGCWVAIWTKRELSATPLTLDKEPERSAGIRLVRTDGRSVLIFGSVLPWRGDTRHSEFRGATAFTRSLVLQSADWDAARKAHPNDALCIAGDFNQELSGSNLVGTRIGRVALENTLKERKLRSLTAGPADPLLEQGWRPSIDHIIVDERLTADATLTKVWPKEYPLSRMLSDHHGVCVTMSDA
jgi:endonuclease/exonuclease/phosphatase family metal-dependent hydrolase